MMVVHGFALSNDDDAEKDTQLNQLVVSAIPQVNDYLKLNS